MSDSWQSHGLQPMRILCPWDSPGKSTGMGYHFLLQGIFLTQGPNGSSELQADSLPSELQGNPLSTIVMPYFYLSIQVARMKGSGYGNLPVVLAYCTVIDNVPFIQYLLPIIVMCMIKNVR